MARQNNDMRWDSTFNMINQALKPQVCRAIEESSTKQEQEVLEAD